MKTDVHDDAELRDRLWTEIMKLRTGMLGLVNERPAQHFQPMSGYAEPESDRIYFFSKSDSDLAVSVAAEEGDAMFIVQSKDQNFQACLSGSLSQNHDRARIERYWNAVAAAWFPEGKDDPKLTLLQLDLSDGAVWISDKGPIRFAIEVAKANMTKKEPDVGDRGSVTFTHTPTH